MTHEEQDEMWLNTRDAAYADVVIMNEDHKCVACDALYPCERPTWDDCDCRIYCERCEEARQETPGP